MFLSTHKLITLVTLVALCKQCITICDTKRPIVKNPITGKEVIIRSKDIEQMTVVAKPIINKKYEQLAAIFTSNNTDLETENNEQLMNARVVTALQILNNSDALFKKEAKAALAALTVLKYNESIKRIVVNSLIRTAIKQLTKIAQEYLDKEKLR